MNVSLLSTGSPFDPQRRQKVIDTSLSLLDGENQRRAASAAVTLSLARQGGVTPEVATRGQVLSETALGSPSFRLLDETTMNALEARVKLQRESEMLQSHPRTAAWASTYENALVGHDDLDTIGFFESMGNAVARGAATLVDTTYTGVQIDQLRESQRLVRDAQKSLDELAEEERSIARGARAEFDQGRPEPLREGVDEETDLPWVGELTAEARGLWRWVSSRQLSWVDPEELKAAEERIGEKLGGVLEDRAFLAREREGYWPTPTWRREIERQMGEFEGLGAGETLTGILGVFRDNPARSMQYLLEIAAESGVPLGAGIAAGAITRNPRMAAGVIGAGSYQLSSEQFFDELVQKYGHDLNSEEGRQAFLRDPAVLDGLRDKGQAYGIVVGLLDGVSGGIASQTLVNNPVGNMVVQMIAQSVLGGGGELFGRLAAGEEIDWTEVFLEAFAEAVTAPVDVGGLALSSAHEKLRSANAARERRTLFEVLAGQVEGSKLRARDQGRFARAIQEVTENGAAENIYIDPDQLDELFQGAGATMTEEEFFSAIPELDRTELERARDTGSQFVIPTSVYAARIAGSKLDAALQQHIRLRPDDMSIAEAEQFTKDLARTQQDLAALGNKVDTLIGEVEGPLAAELERLTSEIVQAQGIATDTARKQAAILVASARAGAQRTGLTVADYLARYSLPAVRAAQDVGPAPARQLVDPSLLLDAVQSPDAVVQGIPDLAEVQSILEERGIDRTTATLNDVIDAMKELERQGRAIGMLPPEERAAPVPGTEGSDEEMMQTASLRSGEEDLRKWGILPDTKYTVRELALKLEARQRSLYGKTPRSQRGPKTIQKFARWMADEIEFELQTPGNEATGWYTTKYQAALDRLGRVFPELRTGKSNLPGLRKVKTAEEARALFTGFLAITSNGAKVKQNFQMAVGLYAQYRATGRAELTTGAGDRAGTVRSSLNRYLQMLTEFDSVAELSQFLNEPLTVREANKELRSIGLPTIGKVPATMAVPRAAALFGPKIGAFYSNLSGSVGYLTMDLWWTRTINRYRGDVLPRVSGLRGAVNSKGMPIGLNRFKVLIQRPDLTDSQALNYATEYAQRYADKGYKNGTEAEKAANTIYKDAFVKLAEAPENASDRAFMLEVARAARNEVEVRTGRLFSIADIQALIWYYEKRLYADMGVRESGDVSYEEAAEHALRSYLREQQEALRQGPRPNPAMIDTFPFEPRQLEAARARAEGLMSQKPRSVLTAFRNKGLDGVITAQTKIAVEMPVAEIEALEGTAGEQRKPGDEKFDKLQALVTRYGFRQDRAGDEIDIRVNHRGEAFVYEGNTRLAVARAMGVKKVRVRVTWFNGGEQVEGPLSPTRVAEATADQTFYQSAPPRPADRLPDLEAASPGPVPGVRELASAYMRERGLPVRHQASYVKVDVARAQEVARLYDEMEHAPNDPEVKAAYAALAEETLAQYEYLLKLGMRFDWITGEDPYDSPADAIRDMQENNHLWVFPTTSGFGTLTEAGLDNPLLAPTPYWVNGRRALVNDIFRIVHDVFGHGSEGASFGPRGEENAWQAHVRMFSPLAARAMTTETRGQNSWVNYGPYGEQNRRDPKNTVFADQKTGLLPAWVSEVGQADDVEVDVQPTRAPTDPARLEDFKVADIEDLTLEAFQRPGWFIVSASLDAFGPATSPDNVARAQEMKKLLDDSGLEYLELEGFYAGKPDGTAFLAIGSRKEGVTIATAFNQESVLLNEGLIYTDGSNRVTVPFAGLKKGWDAKYEDFYSHIKDLPPNGNFSLELQFPKPTDLPYSKDNPTTHYGAKVTPEGYIEMVHWSPQELHRVDPLKAGSGALPGPERKRSGPKKSFFGINQDEPTGYKRESRLLGNFRHTVYARPDDMYPYALDPDGFRERLAPGLSDTQRIGAYEEMIKDAGYAGYFVTGKFAPLGDVAVLFSGVQVSRVDYVNEAPRVRSQEFRGWFKESAVVNRDGSPRMLMHGSRAPSDFTGFRRLSHFGTLRAARDRLAPGTFIGSDGRVQYSHGVNSRNIPAYLSIQKPLRINEPSGVPWQRTEDMLLSVVSALYNAKAASQAKALRAAIRDTDYAKSYIAWAEKRFGEGTSFGRPVKLSFVDIERDVLSGPTTQFEGIADYWNDYVLPYVTGLIQEAGFDGLVYENKVEDPGNDSYVILEPGQAKSPWNTGLWDINNADLLLQQNRGSIILPADGSQATINVFERADLSTILHETGHFFLWQLQRQRDDGLASSAAMLETVRDWWMKNADAIAAEASVDAAQVVEYLEVGTTGQGDVDRAVHVALHEQFARGFEAYAMEGKSPSNALRTVFEAFAAWLLALYRGAKGLNVQIDADIRGVFDRLVATEEEIAKGALREGVDDAIAETAREMGLDPDSYRRLVVLSEEARDEARQKARADLLSPIALMRSRSYRERYAEIEAEERAAVNARPVNRVMQWLGYGRWLGVGQPEELPIELRMDTDLLARDFPEYLDKLPRGRRPLHIKGTGLSADEVAGWFGINSGAEMLKALSEAPKANDEIKARTKARAMEELGDFIQDPEQVDEKVADALHGEKRGQVIVAELRAINRVGGAKQRITTRAMASHIAREMIRRMPVREAIQTGRYQAAERRHAERAARLLAEGKTAEAFEEKRKQLIQHALYIESRAADELVGQAERLAGRLKRKGTRENLAPEYLGAIDDILETYSFRKVSGKQELRRERLLAYVEAMKAQGRANELAIPDSVLQAAKPVPYKTLSVQRLQGVYDSLRNIEHTARYKQKLRDARAERELQEVIDDIDAAMAESVGAPEQNRVQTRTDRVMSETKGYFNLARNADTILRRLDNWQDRGPVYRSFKDAIDAAGVVAVQMREKATRDLENLFARYDPSERERMAVRRVWRGYDQALSKWDLISIALNMGNKDNLERLTSRDSRGSFTRQQVDALVDNLERRDWDFVQSVWDYLDRELWPQIKAREERVTGVAPTKVEPLEVQTKHGTFRGGYYPIVYDSRYTATAGEDRTKDLMESMMAGRFGKAQTRNGHTKERASGGGGRTVELGMHVLFGHVNNVIHDLAYGEAVSATWSLLQNPRVRGLFERANRLEDHQALELWVQDVAASSSGGTHALARTLRRLKAGFTISKLAFNMSTVAIQVTGITQSMAVIGTGNMIAGLTQYVSNPKLAVQVKERSRFMAEREKTFQRDVYDIVNSTQLDPLRSRLSDAAWFFTQAGLWAMQKLQYYAVDVPTWLGAHKQGLEMGLSDDEAAVHADRKVARAQASGLYADRTAVERGTLGRTSRQNEFVRLFTALGSYMFAKLNVAEEVIGRAVRDVKDPSANSALAVITAASDLVLLFTVEAVLYNLLKGQLPGADDEEDGWLAFLAKETALSVFGVFPFVRDIASATEGFGGGGAYGGISETVGRALRSLGDAITGEGDVRDLRSVSDLVGVMVPGYPSTAVWRLVDAVGATGEEPSAVAAIMGR